MEITAGGAELPGEAAIVAGNRSCFDDSMVRSPAPLGTEPSGVGLRGDPGPTRPQSTP